MIKSRERALKCCQILREYIQGERELTATELVVIKAIIKRESQKSFYFFSKFVLGFNLLTDQTHERWADNLQERFFVNRKIMRLKPRATYKCLAKGTDLLHVGIDKDYNIVPAKLYNQKDFIDEGIKVILRSGRSFICTKDHPLKTITGWDTPEVGMRIAVKRTINNNYKSKNEAEDYLIGLLIGDGCLRKYTPRLSSHDIEVRLFLENNGYKIGWENTDGTEYSIKGISKLVKNLGLQGTCSHNKFIPDQYEGSAFLLRGLFDTDGHVSKRDAMISYSTVSEKLADDIMRNLHYFGIVARKKFYSYPATKKSPEVNAFIITIPTNFIKKYYESIGFGIVRKQLRLEEIVYLIEKGDHGVHSNIDTIPAEWKNLIDWKPNEKKKIKESGIRIDNNYSTTRNKLSKVAEITNRKEVKNIIDADIFWDEIDSIENIGEVEFSAIGSDIENYMTPDGVIHHNTTLFGISLILWVWATISPRVNIMYTSSNMVLLQEVSDQITKYIDPSSESLYHHVFGVKKDLNSKNTDDVHNIVGRTGKGFSLILKTAGGSTVGIHPNLIIIDDPMDKNDRESASVRKKKERWLDTLKPLLAPVQLDDGRVVENMIFIATRWHFDDLVSYIMRKNEKQIESEKWDIESESIYNDKGKTNYPEFITDEKIAAIKADIDEIFFACQYENRALPEGIQVFNKNRLHFVTAEQVDIINSRIACFFDPSKGKEGSDYPAVIWTAYNTEEMIVFDAIDSKIEISQLIHLIAAKNKRYKSNLMVYEDNGTMLVEESLKRVHKEINHNIQIKPVRHRSNKEQRIISMQPDLYSGFCKFMADYEKRYPELMNQLIYFPVWGHDDFPDVIQMAVENYRKPEFNFVRYEGIS